jgi:hypothetical protein
LANQIANDLKVPENDTAMREHIANRVNAVYDRESSKLGIPPTLSQKEREEN